MNPQAKTAVVKSPCHPAHALRVPTDRGTLSVKCPEYLCGQRFEFSPPQSTIVIPDFVGQKRQPVTIDVDADVSRYARNYPTRQPVIIDTARAAPSVRDYGTTTASVPMIQTVYREFRKVCAITGAPWSAVFHRVGNNQQFVLYGTTAGDRLVLDMMYGKLEALPDVVAERPQAVNFKTDDLVFGNHYRCPCCGHTCGNGHTFIACRYCNSYICRGNVKQAANGTSLNVCQPQCPTYPQMFELTPFRDDVSGYAMTVYQRGQS